LKVAKDICMIISAAVGVTEDIHKSLYVCNCMS